MTKFQYSSGDRPLDGYTIEHALGRGGFGEVYFAVSDAGRQVALKAVQNYEEIELRGISHCMNLKSQHLVSIFDVRKGSDSTPWVIMEYVAGPSLRDILDECPSGLGPEKSTFFTRELAKGLSYLHAAGVVHRDLKPHNVFFEEGVVKIGDYSLSKAITHSHRSGHTMTVGTVHYMAPEISMGRYDKTVDIYALGVMLYEMLTGRPPYTGDSMGEVLMKHLTATPDLSQIDPRFARVVSKAMQREPTDRYQSAEEMAAEIVGVDASVDSMTGFGAASLSMVADHAARRARSASEASTGRVDAALASTQRDQNNDLAAELHPMRQLGRDFGLVAYHAAIIDKPNRPDRVTTGVDPVHVVWRIVLALAVFPPIVWVGAALCQIFQISERYDSVFLGRYLDLFGPYRLPNEFVELSFRILTWSLVIFLNAMAVRGLVRRGILPQRGGRCRLAHLFFSFLTLWVTAIIGVFPIGKFLMVNMLALAVPIAIQNWALLTSPYRGERLRIGPVLFAASMAFVAAEVIGGNSILAVAAVSASALAVQIAARFFPSIDRIGQQPDPAMAVTMDAVELAASASSTASHELQLVMK